MEVSWKLQLQHPSVICHYTHVPPSLVPSLHLFDILIKTFPLFFTEQLQHLRESNPNRSLKNKYSGLCCHLIIWNCQGCSLRRFFKILFQVISQKFAYYIFKGNPYFSFNIRHCYFKHFIWNKLSYIWSHKNPFFEYCFWQAGNIRQRYLKHFLYLCKAFTNCFIKHSFIWAGLSVCQPNYPLQSFGTWY
jgi:hypothetical protein